MIYSDLYTGNREKIPTILGILIVFFIIFFFFNITNKSVRPSKANQVGIKRIEITNLNPIQTDIIWQTQEKEEGWIIYGESQDKLTNMAFDIRDIEEKRGKYLNHYVTLKSLKPDQNYYYLIVSSNKKIIKPDGNYFSFKTPKHSSVITKLNPASGKVLQTNLEPLINGIVLLTVNNQTVPLSTMTKASGEWLIPLNSFFDLNNLNEQSFSGKETAKVEILSENGEISTVINRLEGLSKNSEVIIIGKNFNFLKNENVLSALTEASNTFDFQPIQIIYPKEKALIPGRKPLIKGIAPPLKEINITINSIKTYSAIVKSDKAGNWSYLIPEDLDLGDHKIVVTFNNEGKEVSLIRTFKIINNDNLEGRVLGLASGEPTITIRPTIPASTLYVTPTTNLSITPTNIQLKQAGGVEILPIIGGLALIIIGGGILLAF